MDLIAVVDNQWGIASKGKLMFDLPADMAYFKSMTMGKVVLMGRKTYASLPNPPLEGRVNVVLSASGIDVASGVIVAGSLGEVATLTLDYCNMDIIVIGGGEVYSQCLDICDRAYITHVHADGNADTFMPDLALIGWSVESASEVQCYQGIEYQFVTYRRVDGLQSGIIISK